MAEPTSIAAVFKTVSEAAGALWERGAILLWCLATLCATIFIALAIGARRGLGDTPELLASYGTALALSTIALAVLAAFKTYAELAAPPPLELIPDEQQSRWNQTIQPSGEIVTFMSLRFQATNVSDHPIKISASHLRWPWVRRSRILQSRVMVRHPIGTTYSSEYPIPAHSLTYGLVTIEINRAVGRTGKPRRVVVSIIDHGRRRYRLAFPYVRNT